MRNSTLPNSRRFRLVTNSDESRRRHNRSHFRLLEPFQEHFANSLWAKTVIVAGPVVDSIRHRRGEQHVKMLMLIQEGKNRRSAKNGFYFLFPKLIETRNADHD